MIGVIVVVGLLTHKLTECESPIKSMEMCVIEISTMYSETLKPYPDMWIAFVVEGNNNILDAKTDENGKYTIIIHEPVFEGCEYWVIFYAITRIEDTRDKGKRHISFPGNEVIEFLY